jgi:hypothetical protein
MKRTPFPRAAVRPLGSSEPLMHREHQLKKARLTLSRLERPVHLAIVTLAITGGLLTIWDRRTKQNARPDRVRQPSSKAPEAPRRCLRNPFGPLTSLTIAIVARVLLSWRIAKEAQCSWDGLQVRPNGLRHYRHRRQWRARLELISMLTNCLDLSSTRARRLRFARATSYCAPQQCP